ncbi:nuclear transport factor 2 family protein [Sinorhizobium sp. 7-81]|uniref:nuclear transport factor 2 family protein n=1 Tax=Sinorhizobium sp. 8-89 TaxID=3049089 RepID=UPI0024C41306|nr:nuclear transport factor 2 family protein [Sinorhizobium sp. 8-89]MDK1494627.1 nuclear transport factor 2 family protein [Sinorhizobium sp. 8-89]
MSPAQVKLLARRAKLTACVIGIGVGLTFAAAAQPLTRCENDPAETWLATLNDPAPADDRAIRKLIALYNWALDGQKVAQLDGLFIDTVFYELCNAAGDQLAQSNGEEPLKVYINEYFNDLVSNDAQTRHVESNTLLHAVDASTIQGKTTVVVTLQNSNIETPVLDYTGELRTEFEQVGNVWKFSSITLITDSPKLALRAR